MDRMTVQGLFVFFGFGLETTTSSNMVTTSSRQVPDARRRPNLSGFYYRLRIRYLSQDLGLASDSTPPPSVRRCQNWSTFLPQSRPLRQRRKRATPVHPSETKPIR